MFSKPSGITPLILLPPQGNQEPPSRLPNPRFAPNPAPHAEKFHACPPPCSLTPSIRGFPTPVVHPAGGLRPCATHPPAVLIAALWPPGPPPAAGGGHHSHTAALCWCPPIAEVVAHTLQLLSASPAGSTNAPGIFAAQSISLARIRQATVSGRGSHICGYSR